jgi:hypothetical protein
LGLFGYGTISTRTTITTIMPGKFRRRNRNPRRSTVTTMMMTMPGKFLKRKRNPCSPAR